MKITINYSSKWSNSFSDIETKKVTALSLGAIQESIKGEKVVIGEHDTYEDIMYKINKVHPNFQYNTITKNTVLGVLSRLLGEIRYLNNIIDKEPDHIINKIKDKVSFEMFDREIYNEVIRISTPEKEVQSNGGGVISEKAKNNILLNKNKYSEIFYSLFNITDLEMLNKFVSVLERSKTIEDVKCFFEENKLIHEGQFELYKFIELYNKNIKLTEGYDKEYRGVQKLKREMDEDVEDYIRVIKRIGLLNHNDSEYHLKPNYINLPGILVYLFSNFLLRNGYDICGILTEKKGNIKGIAEASGGLTIKDFYNAFSNKKTSIDSPYFLKTKFFDKKGNKEINQSDFNIGISKEDGVLEIFIDISEEEANELKNRINLVGVSSFQLGKKGLAYVKEINIYE